MTAECCESFAGTDVRGKTIPDSKSCRAKTSSTVFSSCLPFQYHLYHVFSRQGVRTHLRHLVLHYATVPLCKLLFAFRNTLCLLKYCIKYQTTIIVQYTVTGHNPAGHYIKDKFQIKQVQRRFTKMIPELRNLNYETRLKKLNLWTLEERLNHADIVEVFIMFCGNSTVPFVP